MSLIEFRDVSFSYPSQKTPALQRVSFSLERGCHVAVIGGNGSGKSTMARLMTGLLIPGSGQILVDGMDSSDRSLHRKIRTGTGLVFQNPSTQIVATVVREDAAFGPENLALDSREIGERVREALTETSLTRLSGRGTHRLSAGQQQRLAMAGILALGSSCLILDEAESMLNPQGRNQLNKLLDRLLSEGYTIIRITHFMDQAARADRVLLLHGGRLLEDSSPRLFLDKRADLEGWLLKPSPVQTLASSLSHIISDPDEILLEEDLVSALKERAPGNARPVGRYDNPESALTGPETGPETGTGDIVISLRAVSRRYGKKKLNPVQALRDIDFDVHRGESVSIMGTTGSGKSTFLQILNALLLPDKGELSILSQNPLDKKTDLADLRCRVGLVMQQPEKQLFATLVGDDVAFGPRQTGVKGKDLSRRVREALDLVGLSYSRYRDYPVRALSGGQKRKAALAGVLAMNPEVLLLDEPTAGLDPCSAEQMESILCSLQDEGLTMLTVTHDVDQALRLSRRLLVFSEGRIIWDGDSDFFRTHDPLHYGLDYPLISRIALALGMDSLPVYPEELAAVLGAGI